MRDGRECSSLDRLIGQLRMVLPVRRWRVRQRGGYRDRAMPDRQAQEQGYHPARLGEPA